MSAKKQPYGMNSKDIEQMVKKHLQDAFQGDFFKSMHSMRDQQIERIKELQKKYGDLDQLAFWDILNKGSYSNNVQSTKLDQQMLQQEEALFQETNEKETAEQGLDQMAGQLQQQIQLLIAHVLKSNMDHNS